MKKKAVFQVLFILGMVVNTISGPQISVKSMTDGLWENNTLKEKIIIVNTGDQPLSDFTMYYYFTVENNKTPILENWWNPNCQVTLEQISGNDYKVKFDYSGTTLNPGSALPDEMNGNNFGLHYADWSLWNRANDYSFDNSANYVINNKICVFNNNQLLWGTDPLSQPVGSAPLVVTTDITIADADKNGSEAVLLDGSECSDPDGTITEYHWIVNGTEIGTGLGLNYNFSVGTTVVTLKVKDNSGNFSQKEFTVSVENGSTGYPYSLKVYMKDDGLGENNTTKPRIYIENTGTSPVTDFKVIYKVTTENSKQPVLEDWYSPNCNVTIEGSNSEYSVIMDFTGYTLEPGKRTPENTGIIFGLHYDDWSVWNKNDDPSNNLATDFAVAPGIIVLVNGEAIYGVTISTMRIQTLFDKNIKPNLAYLEPRDEKSAYYKNQLIYTVNGNISAGAVAAAIQDVLLNVTGQSVSVLTTKMFGSTYRFTFISDADAKDLKGLLANRTPAINTEINPLTFTSTDGPDTHLKNQLVHNFYSTSKFWDANAEKSGVIAVFDSYMDKDNPDLAHVLLPEISFVSQDESGITSKFLHGTWMAQIIAADRNNSFGVAGINSRLTILPIRVISNYGTGSAIDLARAIMYVADNCPDVKLLNVSAGTMTSVSYLEDAVNYAVSKGKIIVAAMGNDASNLQIYPAAYNAAISVGASNPVSDIWAGSNYGVWADVYALGTGYCYAESNNAPLFGSGTSFACAAVTGFLSMLDLSSKNAASVETLLKATGDNILFQDAIKYSNVVAKEINPMRLLNTIHTTADVSVKFEQKQIFAQPGGVCTFKVAIQNRGPQPAVNTKLCIIKDNDTIVCNNIGTVNGDQIISISEITSKFGEDGSEPVITAMVKCDDDVNLMNNCALATVNITSQDVSKLVPIGFELINQKYTPGDPLKVKCLICNVGNSPSKNGLKMYFTGSPNPSDMKTKDDLGEMGTYTLGSILPGATAEIDMTLSTGMVMPNRYLLIFCAIADSSAYLVGFKKEFTIDFSSGTVLPYQEQNRHKYSVQQALDMFIEKLNQLKEEGNYSIASIENTKNLFKKYTGSIYYMGDYNGNDPYYSLGPMPSELCIKTYPSDVIKDGWVKKSKTDFGYTRDNMMAGAFDCDEVDIVYKSSYKGDIAYALEADDYLINAFNTHFMNVDKQLSDFEKSLGMSLGRDGDPSAYEKIAYLLDNKVDNNSCYLQKGAIQHYDNGKTGEAFYLLGHALHLIGDLGTPEHVKYQNSTEFYDFISEDYSHGLHYPAYETWMGLTEAFGGFEEYYTFNNTGLLIDNLIRQNKDILINPYQFEDPLHGLCYTTAQLADYFAWAGEKYNTKERLAATIYDWGVFGEGGLIGQNGNTNVPDTRYANYMSNIFAECPTRPVNYRELDNNRSLYIDTRKNELGMQVVNGWERDVNNDDGDLSAIANASYNYSLRAMAGLMLYFAKESGMLAELSTSDKMIQAMAELPAMSKTVAKTYSNYGLFGFERMNTGSDMTRSQVFSNYRVAGNDIMRVFSNTGVPDAGCGFDEATEGGSSAMLRSSASVYHLDLMSPATIDNSMAANNVNHYSTGTEPYHSVLINPGHYQMLVNKFTMPHDQRLMTKFDNNKIRLSTPRMLNDEFFSTRMKCVIGNLSAAETAVYAADGYTIKSSYSVTEGRFSNLDLTSNGTLSLYSGLYLIDQMQISGSNPKINCTITNNEPVIIYINSATFNSNFTLNVTGGTASKVMFYINDELSIGSSVTSLSGTFILPHGEFRWNNPSAVLHGQVIAHSIDCDADIDFQPLSNRPVLQTVTGVNTLYTTEYRNSGLEICKIGSSQQMYLSLNINSMLKEGDIYEIFVYTTSGQLVLSKYCPVAIDHWSNTADISTVSGSPNAFLKLTGLAEPSSDKGYYFAILRNGSIVYRAKYLVPITATCPSDITSSLSRLSISDISIGSGTLIVKDNASGQIVSSIIRSGSSATINIEALPKPANNQNSIYTVSIINNEAIDAAGNLLKYRRYDRLITVHSAPVPQVPLTGFYSFISKIQNDYSGYGLFAFSNLRLNDAPDYQDYVIWIDRAQGIKGNAGLGIRDDQPITIGTAFLDNYVKLNNIDFIGECRYNPGVSINRGNYYTIKNSADSTLVNSNYINNRPSEQPFLPYVSKTRIVDTDLSNWQIERKMLRSNVVFDETVDQEIAIRCVQSNSNLIDNNTAAQNYNVEVFAGNPYGIYNNIQMNNDTLVINSGLYFINNISLTNSHIRIKAQDNAPVILYIGNYNESGTMGTSIITGDASDVFVYIANRNRSDVQTGVHLAGTIVAPYSKFNVENNGAIINGYPLSDFKGKVIAEEITVNTYKHSNRLNIIEFDYTTPVGAEPDYFVPSTEPSIAAITTIPATDSYLNPLYDIIINSNNLNDPTVVTFTHKYVGGWYTGYNLFTEILRVSGTNLIKVSERVNFSTSAYNYTTDCISEWSNLYPGTYFVYICENTAGSPLAAFKKIIKN